MSEPGTEAGTYEAWVQRVAAALHEDCILEWKAILVVDPKRELTQHATDAHYGKAHNLVRRLGLAAARGYRLVPASPEPPAGLDMERLREAFTFLGSDDVLADGSIWTVDEMAERVAAAYAEGEPE